MLLAGTFLFLSAEGQARFSPLGWKLFFPAVCWNAFTVTSEGGNLKSLLAAPQLNLIHISGTNMSWISIGWSYRSCNSNTITQTYTYSLFMGLIKCYFTNLHYRSLDGIRRYSQHLEVLHTNVLKCWIQWWNVTKYLLYFLRHLKR